MNIAKSSNFLFEKRKPFNIYKYFKKEKLKKISRGWWIYHPFREERVF